MDNSPFNKLSAELRNEIYALALRQDQAVDIAIDSTTDKLTTRVKNATALTQTCKQIYQESSSMFYSLNRFVISKDIDSNTKSDHEPDGEEETSQGQESSEEEETVGEEQEEDENEADEEDADEEDADEEEDEYDEDKNEDEEEASEVDILEHFLETIGPKNCAALSHLVVQIYLQTEDQDQNISIPELRDLPDIAEEFKPSHLAVQISLENESRETVSAGFNVLEFRKSLTEAASQLMSDFEGLQASINAGEEDVLSLLILGGDLASVLHDLEQWQTWSNPRYDFSREVADVVPWD